jgi:hypothetical protein
MVSSSIYYLGNFGQMIHMFLQMIPYEAFYTCRY